MAKKRKAGGRPAAHNKPKESERTKFDIEERFDDSGDEFQAGRDQILLDEAPDAKRRRRVAEEEEMLQPSDEEIMGYDDVDVDEDDLDDEDDEEEEDEGADDYEDYEEDAIGEPSKNPKNKRRDASPGSEAYEDEDEEGIAAWGSSKKDLYNADQIETEADALEEEQEAKRLQQKHLRAMNEADFGFDETEWADAGKEDKDAGKDTTEVTEVLPQVEVTEDMSAEEKLKILKSRYPEFEPLAKDFADLQPTHRDLAQDAKAAEKSREPEDEDDEDAAPVAVVKFRALSAYLGTISMYFMLLTSSQDASGNPSPMPPAELRGHPVMGSLVKFRKLWESVKDLQTPEVSESEDEEMEESQIIAEPEPPKTEKKKQAKEQKQTKKLSKAERAAQAAQAEAEARRAERLRETEANLADLSTLATDAKKRKAQKTKASAKNADDSDFGDEDALTAKEAEEKAKQKRSLRFYTSQLAQKANKRSAAGRDAGGDEDLPYRERLKDRQARLNAEAEKRGKKQLSKEEQLGDDSDEEDHRTAQQIRGDQSDSDDYYDMVAARTNQRKDDKKSRAEAHAEAARQGGQVAVQEEVGPDGKRAITYQIEKNKGLAPKRNKDVRNPRVKKRKKFEDKKKKLGSIRQQYKGGEGRGGYSGELTGIKKNLVKSVKL